MKLVLIGLAILLSTASQATENQISKVDEHAVVSYLNNICADTYCGGNFNYHIHDAVCIDNFCALSFTMKEYEFTNESPVIENMQTLLNRRISTMTLPMYSVEPVAFETEDVDGVEVESVMASCYIADPTIPEMDQEEMKQAFYGHMTTGCAPLAEMMAN